MDPDGSKCAAGIFYYDVANVMSLNATLKLPDTTEQVLITLNNTKSFVEIADWLEDYFHQHPVLEEKN